MESLDDQNAELYAKLFPYILRDFMLTNDLKSLLILAFPELELLNSINLDTSSEGIKKALQYKKYLDDGDDDLSKKIKPVIGT